MTNPPKFHPPAVSKEVAAVNDALKAATEAANAVWAMSGIKGVIAVTVARRVPREAE